MKIRGFARDESGNLVPPGMTEVKYEQNFLNGENLPSWLTGTSDSVVPSAWGAGTPGGITLSTAATVGSDANIQSFPIPQDQFAAISFEVKGLKFTNMFTSTISFGIYAGSIPYGGAFAVQRSTEDWMSFAIPGQGSTQFGVMGYTLRTLGESVKYHNIGFMLNCRTHTCIFYEDDPAFPVGTLDVGDSIVQSAGQVSARLRLQSNDDKIQSMKIAKVVLRLWQEPLNG